MSVMARREAERQARRVPWELLQEARKQYIEWNAFSLWVRAIKEAEGEIPDWLAKVVEDCRPGLLEDENAQSKAYPDENLDVLPQHLKRVEGKILDHARQEGWLRAVTFYAVREPVFLRDLAYSEYCVHEWKRKRPSPYPSFEEWRRASEQCSDDVLDAFEMREDKRRIVHCAAGASANLKHGFKTVPNGCRTRHGDGFGKEPLLSRISRTCSLPARRRLALHPTPCVPVRLSGVVSAGFSLTPDFVVGITFTRNVLSFSRTTAVITVRPASKGISSSNTLAVLLSGLARNP